MRLAAAALLLLVGALLGYGVAKGVGDPSRRLFGGGAEVAGVAAATLKAAQSEARMSVFAARFVVAVTSEEKQFGLSARRTMIVPATVRYEIDWTRITPADLTWDAANRALIVRAPEPAAGPAAVELRAIQVYGSQGLLPLLTDAEDRLDASNRGAIDAAVAKEAANPLLREMARKAARDTIARTFRLPLEAAGTPASVIVRFPGEAARAM